MKVIRSSHGEFQTDERGLIVTPKEDIPEALRNFTRVNLAEYLRWCQENRIVPAEVIDILLVGLWYADADGEDYEPPEVLARECLVLELVDATEVIA